MLKTWFKIYLVIKLESEFFTTKIQKLLFFWKYLPSTMFWQWILGPQTPFSILTLFLFTLKAGCSKNRTFSSWVNLNPLKIHISPTFLNILVHNLRILMFSRQNQAKMLIFSPQMCIRVSSNENPNFFKDSVLNPYNLKFSNFYFKK